MSSKVFSTTGKGCVWILFEEYSVVHNFSEMKGQIGESRSNIVEKHLCKVYSADKYPEGSFLLYARDFANSR